MLAPKLFNKFRTRKSSDNVSQTRSRKNKQKTKTVQQEKHISLCAGWESRLDLYSSLNPWSATLETVSSSPTTAAAEEYVDQLQEWIVSHSSTSEISESDRNAETQWQIVTVVQRPGELVSGAKITLPEPFSSSAFDGRLNVDCLL